MLFCFLHRSLPSAMQSVRLFLSDRLILSFTKNKQQQSKLQTVPMKTKDYWCSAHIFYWWWWCYSMWLQYCRFELLKATCKTRVDTNTCCAGWKRTNKNCRNCSYKEALLFFIDLLSLVSLIRSLRGKLGEKIIRRERERPDTHPDDW